MNHRSLVPLTGLVALLLGACGGGGGGDSEGGGSFQISEASNGFGRLLPYSIAIPDPLGQPTGQTVEIRSLATLMEHIRPQNPIIAPVEWDANAVLPDRRPGNHFIYVRFNQKLDIESVLSRVPTSGADNNLVGNIKVVSVDANTGETTDVPGRGFVDGFTTSVKVPNVLAAGELPGQLRLEQWITLDKDNNGQPDPDGMPGARTAAFIDDNGDEVVSTPGLGFPGTQTNFAGASELVDASTFVFVVDGDALLTSHETFPTSLQIQMQITTGVRNRNGRALGQSGVASSTVGDDVVGVEVLVSGGTATPVSFPRDLDTDVDPETNIELFFSEPVDLFSVGDLDDGTIPNPSGAIQLQFGSAISPVEVPFSVTPLSPYDLTHVQLRPEYAFPGSGPELGTNACADFATVTVRIQRDQLSDLSENLNLNARQFTFTTAEGPGLVNAPVLPDAIYLGRAGSKPGISVLDLNGFGQGPGDPDFDPLQPIRKGKTNFPNNLNVQVQGASLIPPLAPGTCTVDGGSSGPLTLARDSSLGTILATVPQIQSVEDMALGHALDSSFNNGSPFGCQAGGGNICAATGLKLVGVNGGAGPFTYAPSQTANATFLVKSEAGVENPVIWAPHPNPPPLVFPPLCLSPLIGGEEPTSVDVTLGFNILGTVVNTTIQNLVTPSSNGLGRPEINQPPEGLLSLEQNSWFVGPSSPQQNVGNCQQYALRQQIGHFLYVADRSNQEVVVFNSNRFNILDRIPMPDPTSFAMSPNLDLLAVTNFGADLVAFIDTNPASGTFHQVVKTTQVGSGPSGICWQPDNEDVLVCNQGESTLSILRVHTLEVRKVVRNQLRAPFEVVATHRENAHGLSRAVYFAYVLNSDGTVALFESGPDGINGWGFDDVVASLPYKFTNPKALMPDFTALISGFWVAHENQLDVATGALTGRGGGAITNVFMSSGTLGRIPLDPGGFGNPRVRDIQFAINASIGSDQLTGIPVDLCFDNLRNRTAQNNLTNNFSASNGISMNGKAILKIGTPITTITPQFLFAAVPNSNEGPGVVDVIDLASGYRRFDTNPFDPGVQSIPASNVSVVADFMRQ